MRSFKILKWMPYLLFAWCGIAFISCSKDKNDGEACNSTLPDTISFQNDVLPIFNSSCSLSACHRGTFPAGNLNLEASQAYEELTKPGSGYVNTGNPTHSILYSMLISKTQPMPPDEKLDPCKIETILRWIEQGALNN